MKLTEKLTINILNTNDKYKHVQKVHYEFPFPIKVLRWVKRSRTASGSYRTKHIQLLYCSLNSGKLISRGLSQRAMKVGQQHIHHFIVPSTQVNSIWGI
jgi:hypothetical protein